MPLTDTHTHNPDAVDAVINYDPTVDTYPLDPTRRYSVGIHPWRADMADDDALARLEALAGEQCVVAIGETGLDKLRGPALDIQSALLLRHIALARATGKPLILHIVRAWQELLQIARQTAPLPTPCIIHGFRGKPQLARQLLDAGFSLSFCARYNPESFALTPVGRRYAESDEATLPDLPGPVTTLG